MGRPRRRRNKSAQASDARSIPGVSPGNDGIVQLWGDNSSYSSSGMYVDEDLALSLSAVYRAIAIISSSIASMPLKLYKKLPNGGREEVTDHPVADLLSWSPDNGVTASYTWRESQTAHALLAGNGCAEIVRNGRGQPVAIHLIDNPRRVTFKYAPDHATRIYSVQNFDKTKTLYPYEVLHIPALSFNGWFGQAPLTVAKDTIGLAKAAETYGSRFYKHGGRPIGFLTKPNQMTDKQRDTLQKEWAELHGTIDRANTVGILSGGLDWKSVSVSPEEAQFLSTRKFQVEELARWYGVPPHMLASMENAKYSNIEQMLLEFLIFTLLPWIRRWESELNLKMFTARESFKYYAEFNFDALIRVDTKTKYEAYERQLKNGMRTLNELRSLDNMDPYSADIGDIPLVQANNIAPLQQVVDGTFNNNSQQTASSDTTIDPSSQNFLAALVSHLPEDSIERVTTAFNLARKGLINGY